MTPLRLGITAALFVAGKTPGVRAQVIATGRDIAPQAGGIRVDGTITRSGEDEIPLCALPSRCWAGQRRHRDRRGRRNPGLMVLHNQFTASTRGA